MPNVCGDRTGLYDTLDVFMTPDAAAYAYSAARALGGDLFVIDGLH